MARRTKDRPGVFRIVPANRANHSHFIDGKPVPFIPMQAKIVACLLKNQGEAVPYKKLCSLLESERDIARAKRTLSQHVGQIKGVLASKKTGRVIAVAHHVGYVLCKIAKYG